MNIYINNEMNSQKGSSTTDKIAKAPRKLGTIEKNSVKGYKNGGHAREEAY